MARDLGLVYDAGVQDYIDFLCALNYTKEHRQKIVRGPTPYTSAAAALNYTKEHCDFQSHKYKGMCLSKNNCANVCQTEGFLDGAYKTQRITRRCFFRKVC